MSENEIKAAIGMASLYLIAFCSVAIVLMVAGVPLWELGDWLHTPWGMLTWFVGAVVATVAVDARASHRHRSDAGVRDTGDTT